MATVIVPLNDEKAKDWSEFVLFHPDGNIFQTPEMVEVYRRNNNLQPVALLAISQDNDQIIGGVIGIVSVEQPGLLSVLSTRAIIEGGPLCVPGEKGDQACISLLHEFDHIVQRKAIFSEIWNLFERPGEWSSWLGGTFYVWEDHLNFIIDLQQSEEQLFANFSKSRRKNLRKTEELEVTISEIADISGIEPFYEMLCETYRRVKVPLPSIRLFQDVFEGLSPKGMVHFFLAHKDERVIGARAVLTYKDLIYDWYAGSSHDASELYPDEALVWHILRWGIRKGFNSFNFGGAGKPGEEYGPREFKRRFGGQLMNLGRYRKVYSPLKLKLAETGYRFYQKLR